ncbi:MAG: hypothetical protein ABR591_15040 [Candidatus Velthaea sp.]
MAENAQRLVAGESPAEIGGGEEIPDLDRVYLAMTRRIAQTLREREEALDAYSASTTWHQCCSAPLPQELPRVDGLRMTPRTCPLPTVRSSCTLKTPDRRSR